MGAEAWSYFVPYRENIAEALEALQEQEFRAGRYQEPAGPHPAPNTIADVMNSMSESGTRSILDMIGVVDSPRPSGFRLEDAFEGDVDFGFMHVAPLSTEQLLELFGTDRPARTMIEQNFEFYEWLDRGLGLYIVAYDDDQPSEICFAGYSLD